MKDAGRAAGTANPVAESKIFRNTSKIRNRAQLIDAKLEIGAYISGGAMVRCSIAIPDEYENRN
jgi:hypothetical protein